MSSIMKKLTSPDSVAHSLRWCSQRSSSASILTLVIGNNMELGLSPDPEVVADLEIIAPIHLEKDVVGTELRLAPQVSHELSQVVEESGVCGVVVHWPVQSHGGCGKACGTVLYTLEQLVRQNDKLFSASRPICLFDVITNRPLSDDAWGRSAQLSGVVGSSKDFHRASLEQYVPPTTTRVLDVWDSFLRVHWPHIWESQQQRDELHPPDKPFQLAEKRAWLQSQPEMPQRHLYG